MTETFAAGYNTGDMVRGRVASIDVPFYVEHPLNAFLGRLRGRTSHDEFKLPPEAGRLKSDDVGIVVAQQDLFVLIVVGDKVGWISEGLIVNDNQNTPTNRRPDRRQRHHLR